MGWLNFLYASMTIFFGLDAMTESSKNSTVICIVAMILLVIINLF